LTADGERALVDGWGTNEAGKEDEGYVVEGRKKISLQVVLESPK
jgi:hypothetical protein